jgi:hypothetical protein
MTETPEQRGPSMLPSGGALRSGRETTVEPEQPRTWTLMRFPLHSDLRVVDGPEITANVPFTVTEQRDSQPETYALALCEHCSSQTPDGASVVSVVVPYRVSKHETLLSIHPDVERGGSSSGSPGSESGFDPAPSLSAGDSHPEGALREALIAIYNEAAGDESDSLTLKGKLYRILVLAKQALSDKPEAEQGERVRRAREGDIKDG